MKHLSLNAFVLVVCVIFAASAGAAAGDRFYVQEESAAVHEGPAATAPVVMWLYRGDGVEEFERDGLWARVGVLKSGGKEGWVQLPRLGPEPPEGAATDSEGTDDDTIYGAIKLPKPEAHPLLHSFALVLRGTAGGITGHCRVITGSGATKRFNLGPFAIKTYKIKAKAIRCSIAIRGFGGRLTVKLWADGDLLGSKTLDARNTYSYTFWTPWDW